MCMIPHQRHLNFAFFSYPTTKGFDGVLGRYESRAYLHHIFLLSQKPYHKEMQVIHSDQDVQVCGIFHIVPILNIFVLLVS
jgi:hypothetical protein